MGSIPYAFSVHHFINSVGSDAGFAAIVGLAILVLLYFAQARETSALRHQAYDWSQRVQQLEARLAQLARQQQSSPASQAVPPPPGVARPVASRAAPAAVAGTAAAAYVATSRRDPTRACAPWAPAGVGAPALSAATRLIPADAPAALSAPVPLSAAAVAAGAAIDAGGEPLRTSSASALAEHPDEWMPFDGHDSLGTGSNGDGVEPLGSPASYAGGRAATLDAPPRGSRPLGDDAAPPRRTAVPPGGFGLDDDDRPRGSRRTLALVLGGLVAAVVVVAAVLIVSSSSSSPTKTNPSSAAAAAAERHRTAPTSTAAVDPKTVNVAVLNGTDTSGLAGRIAQKLSAAGYKPGLVGNATNQTQSKTTVAYRAGSQLRALSVAKALGLSSTVLQPLNQTTQQIACAQQSPCKVNVVVTVGQNLATSA